MIRAFFLCLFLISALGCAESTSKEAKTNSDTIRLNQLGYYPKLAKKAIVVNVGEARNFELVELPTKEIVFSAELSKEITWDLAGETVKVADFSSFQEEGSFMIYVEELGYSHPFDIKKTLLDKAFKATIKGQYFQRASMELQPEFAQQWERALGHPDDSVLFHPSTNKSGVTTSPKGWYDAGDYGKYVVNGAFALGQMMTFFEQYPEHITDGDLNIPESGNGVSDLLDELKYELDWLLSMQDDDGGVFFKLTTKNFEGMVMPIDAIKSRYIIGKGTASTLDFAAVTAKAARIFMVSDTAYAKRCREASEKAWNWAIANRDVNYRNPQDVSTGEYGDEDFSQEFYWAAAELLITTKSVTYQEYLVANPLDFTFTPGESWANFMHYLGAFSLIDHLDNSPLKEELKNAILAEGDRLVALSNSNAYLQPVEDFQWGSNSDVLNTAMIIAQAYRINPNPDYLNAVQGITDYIFGKNATGYSFLTGFGHKTPQFIHHRPSSADGIPEPVPGLLSGGPNSDQQDQNQVNYPDNIAPMKSWMDVEPSFASNEVCLNWNSAAVYVLGFLEAETD